MTQRKAGPPAHVSRMRAVCVVSAFMAICAAFFAVMLVRAQDASADWEKAAGGKMSFEVASVKPNNSTSTAINSNFMLLGQGQPPNGILTATNFPLVLYIAFAYKLDRSEATDLKGLPSWAGEERFDIEARPPGTGFTRDQVRLMMQSMLADRFKLAVKSETKEVPVNALVLAKPGKLGSQLKPYPDAFPCSDVAGAGSEPRGGDGPPTVPTIDGRFPASCGQISRMTPSGTGLFREAGRNISMDSIIGWIGGFVPPSRPVVDRTGLTGTFDLSVEFELPDVGGSVKQPSSSLETAFLEAMNDQLGLKLQSTTAPVSTIVIAHIEEPTPN